MRSPLLPEHAPPRRFLARMRPKRAWPAGGCCESAPVDSKNRRLRCAALARPGLRLILCRGLVLHLNPSMATRKTTRCAQRAETYRHLQADSPMRPEVGTQAQFRKKKTPATYRYDSSLSPALEWDGQNPAREQGEVLRRRILEADTLE